MAHFFRIKIHTSSSALKLHSELQTPILHPNLECVLKSSKKCFPKMGDLAVENYPMVENMFFKDIITSSP